MYKYALDISMTNTGVAIFDQNNKLVHVTSISTTDKSFKKIPFNLAYGAKLKHHFDEINKIIEQYPPSMVAIERGFSRFNKATQVLFRFHGIYTLAFHNVPNYYYSPSEVKKTIYKGNASKDELAEVISKRLKVKFNNDDESDAVAVGLTHLIIAEGYPWKGVKKLTKKDIQNAEKKKKKK